jgi:predicted nucleic acid-binding protein
MSEEKFLLEDEPGANRVKQIFFRQKVFLPWTVLMEVYYMTLYEKGEEEAETRFAMLRHSSAEILWEMTEAATLRAARIKAQNKLSFADAVIASLAMQNEAILVHKDPEYEQLKDQLQISNSRYENYVWVLLAWIAKSKPTSQDLAILRSHNGNC